MITDYAILTANDPEELAMKVRRSIKAGFQPQGGVTVVPDQSADPVRPSFLYSQAMVEMAKSDVDPVSELMSKFGPLVGEITKVKENIDRLGRVARNSNGGGGGQ